MTGLLDLVVDCNDRGIRFVLAGDSLTIDAPQKALTPELIDRLKSHKADIMAALALEPEPIPADGDTAADAVELVPCSTCGGLMAWWDAWGDRHCTHCKRPATAMRLLNRAKLLRLRLGLPDPDGALELFNGLSSCLSTQR